MSWTNDSKPVGSYTDDTGVVLGAYYGVGKYGFSKYGTTNNSANDSKPSGSYVNDSKPS